MEEKNLMFTEKLVDMDDAAKTEMMASSGGFLGVPFILIIKDDGARDTVVGFDKGKLDSVLAIQA